MDNREQKYYEVQIRFRTVEFLDSSLSFHSSET